MFESLTERRGNRFGMSQPVLALAVHAGLILVIMSSTRPVARPMSPVSEASVLFPVFVPQPETRISGHGGFGHPGPLRVVSPPLGLPVLPGPIPDLPFSLRPVELRRLAAPFRLGDSTSMTGPGDSAIQVADLSEPPVLLHLVEPQYPEALRQAGIQGVVSVIYVVDAQGDVEPTSITFVSTDHPAMAESVWNALVAAKFRPGRLRGKPVRTLVRQLIRFTTSG
jgi:TonB family protein